MNAKRFNRFRRGRSQVTVLAAAGVAAVLVLVGCSSSSSSSASSSTSASGSSTSAGTATAKGSPIAVGSIGSYTGPEASSLQGVEDTVQAWVTSTNAAGGLDGHPIKLYLDDDATSPSTAVSDVQTLITQDHVVAIVADASASDTAWASIAAKAGVPVVGGLPLSVSFGTNPDFFASGTNFLAFNYGTIALAKTMGPKFAYLYCAELAACQSGLPLILGLAKAAGETVTYTGSVSASATDYTATCEAIKNSGASAYEIGDNSAVMIKIATACKQDGVAAPIVTNVSTVIPQLATVPAANGFRSADADTPFYSDSTPGIKAYHAALAKYVPQYSSEGSADGVYVWAAGQLFNAAVKAAGATTVTSASVLQGLYDLKGTTLGGLTPPLTFTKGQSAQIDCYFVEGAENGKFTLPQGLTTSCAPAPVITGLNQKLSAAA